MTVSIPPQNEDTVLRTFTDWQGYLKFLAAVEGTGVRVNYDRGKLELMTPSRKHERDKRILGALIEHLAIRDSRDFEPGGSMTFSRSDLGRGLEPNECYWFQRYAEVAGRESYDSSQDPPPDLVIEVDVTASATDRIDIYRSMGVEEVWHLTSTGFRILLLVNERYELSDFSRVFENLSQGDIEAYLEFAQRKGITAAMRRLVE